MACKREKLKFVMLSKLVCGIPTYGILSELMLVSRVFYEAKH